jgi:hypothetical protein
MGLDHGGVARGAHLINMELAAQQPVMGGVVMLVLELQFAKRRRFTRRIGEGFVLLRLAAQDWSPGWRLGTSMRMGRRWPWDGGVLPGRRSDRRTD